MALDLLNVGDSRATTKAKLDAAFAEVGLPASGDTTEATDTFNEMVTDYLVDPLPGLTDRMAGGTARSHINAAITALNEGKGGRFVENIVTSTTIDGRPFAILRNPSKTDQVQRWSDGTIRIYAATGDRPSGDSTLVDRTGLNGEVNRWRGNRWIHRHSGRYRLISGSPGQSGDWMTLYELQQQTIPGDGTYPGGVFRLGLQWWNGGNTPNDGYLAPGPVLAGSYKVGTFSANGALTGATDVGMDFFIPFPNGSSFDLECEALVHHTNGRIVVKINGVERFRVEGIKVGFGTERGVYDSVRVYRNTREGQANAELRVSSLTFPDTLQAQTGDAWVPSNLGSDLVAFTTDPSVIEAIVNGASNHNHLVFGVATAANNTGNQTLVGAAANGGRQLVKAGTSGLVNVNRQSTAAWAAQVNTELPFPVGQPTVYGFDPRMTPQRPYVGVRGAYNQMDRVPTVAFTAGIANKVGSTATGGEAWSGTQAAWIVMARGNPQDVFDRANLCMGYLAHSFGATGNLVDGFNFKDAAPRA